MAGDKENKKKRKADEAASADGTAEHHEGKMRKKERHAGNEEEGPSAAGGTGGRGGGATAGGRGAAPKGRGRGGGGRGGGQWEDTSKPTALQMLRPKNGRTHTLSVALPASIVENAQSWELRAVLVGQIARAFTIFGVDEVVLFEDRTDTQWDEGNDGDEGVSRNLAFFARNLQYLETPQYLRRQLLPMHRDLKWVGLLPPLDAPHHLRKSEKLAYREGAVLPRDQWPSESGPGGGGGGGGSASSSKGCWANCGLHEPVWLEGADIPSDVRVTVRMEQQQRGGWGGEEDEGKAWPRQQRGAAVPPREPTTKMGLYWGYSVRVAASLKAVFDECPYEDGGYDLTFGTSERGEAGVSKVPRFRHLLLAFGGVGGFEEVIADSSSGYPKGTDPSKLFNRYLNVCPNQTSRTIRTEEAVMIALSVLSPYLPER